MKTDDFIGQLARDAKAEAPLPAPTWRTAAWLLWALFYCIVLAVTMFMVTPATDVALTPLYFIQQGAAVATAITAARAAFGSVIPGAQARMWGPPTVSVAVWVGLMLWNSVLDVRAAGTLGVTSQTDWPCVASMAMGAIVLGGPLVLMLRRGAPLTPRGTAFLAGLAALSVANIEACLTRPHAFAITVLLWHGLTVVLVACIFAMFGRRWLRWPTMAVR